jgi:hypothetical protein
MTTIAESICLKIHARAGLGLAKYGVSLDDAPLTRLQVLRHAQEEMIDAAEYLEKEIQAEEKRLEEQTLSGPAPGNASGENVTKT